MGEINFDITRMREVYQRIDEISEQLNSKINEDYQILQYISQKINSDSISSILKKYAYSNKEKCDETRSLLNSLKIYLSGQIASYSKANTAAQEELNNINSTFYRI